MRKLMGLCVMLAGVIALGWYAAATVAPRIESSLALRAALIAQGARQPLVTEVSGRDIAVRGTVEDPEDFARIEARFLAIDGARAVDLSGLSTLSVVTPYEARIAKVRGGDISVTGWVPSSLARARVEDAVSRPEGAALELAAGAPEGWADTLVAVIETLETAISAEVTLTDTGVQAELLAATPAERATLTAGFDALPDSFTVDLVVEVEDDGTPMSLSLTLADGDVTGDGKLPAGMARESLMQVLPAGAQLDLVQSRLSAPVEGWADAAQAGARALAQLTEARLDVEGTAISLEGAGSPEAVEAARGALSSVTAPFETRVDLRLYDDGAPLALSVGWSGTEATVSGKLPAGYELPDWEGAPLSDTASRSFLPDEDGTFTRNADLAVQALGLLNSGQVTVTAQTITLSGTASSPRVGTAIDEVLSGAAEATISRDLTYLDDGSPAVWVLRFDATEGASVEGRVPEGLTVEDLSGALGLPVAGDPITAAGDAEVGTALDALGVVGTVLPEVETLTFTRDGGASDLDIVTAPGVDLDLIATDLALRLPSDVSFAIAPQTNAPEAGTRRRNAATGLEEVFEGGVWRPDLEFEVDREGCRTRADDILNSAGISFVSGSDRLDATSVRAINALAAVVQPCVAAGLALEIGGHTDSSGSAEANEALSFARATSVLSALAERGVPATGMSAVGFGDSQPIADNDTPEGRAANRRTTLTWADPDAP